MHRSRIAQLSCIPAMMIITSCSSHSGAASASTGAPAGFAAPKVAAPTQMPTMMQLKSDLLRLGDLPRGYSVLRTSAQPIMDAGCLPFMKAIARSGSRRAVVEFESSESSPTATLLEEALISSDIKGAQASFDESVAALKECPELHHSNSKVSLTLHISSESYDSYGTQTRALRLKGSLSETDSKRGIPVTGEVVLIRYGAVNIEVENYRLLLPENASLTRQIISKAVAKMGRIMR